MTSPAADISARPTPPALQEYAPDRLPLRTALIGIAVTALGSGLLTLAGWYIFHRISLPAFNTSMVTRALCTVGIVATVVLVAVLATLWIRDGYKEKEGGRVPRPRWRTWLTYVVSYLSPALLILAALGLPLSATRLWLDGVQVDQVFRTQFLTRSADQMGYADMNYEGLPTFYPLGWFWMGGRLAHLLGIPGWEVFQPWSLISIAVAGCILVPIWQRLTGSLPVATAIALVTTAVTATLGAEEPYSAVIAMGVPAVAVMCAHAFAGSWASTIGITLYLGISATFYTLFTGAVALTVVCWLALLTAIYRQQWRPIFRTIIIGVGSIAIASIAWGPYVLAALRASTPLESTAQHYLPQEGTQVPVPFLSFSIIGLLCLIGLVYLMIRLETPEILSLTCALIGLYLWILASMIVTLIGSTLLGFRLEIAVVLTFATAGILALAELRLSGFKALYPPVVDLKLRQRLNAAFLAVLALGGIHYAQQIPEANESALDHAYSDTDGYGERGDRFTSDSSRHYIDIRDFIDSHGHPADDTVVLTDEKLFMGYNPYFGFNAFTSHYANPLGEFSVRNEQIQQWSKDSWEQDPAQFRQALESAPWRGPDVMIFRGNLEDPGDGFKTHLADDIYPNQPNVRYRSVFFNPEVFTEGWDTKQIGPFVVAVRSDAS
ncbi:galactan 5-O-arabinofuranosyltransferase [Corynebacterium flavescens]|uniref:galactan 5-O-arabinofuranosyltransferase n=1 Tax=Corynebacterium flavescens TaxID=28028 RepID=UPI003FCF46C1